MRDVVPHLSGVHLEGLVVANGFPCPNSVEAAGGTEAKAADEGDGGGAASRSTVLQRDEAGFWVVVEPRCAEPVMKSILAAGRPWTRR